MRFFLSYFALIIFLSLNTYSQDNICLYFPMDIHLQSTYREKTTSTIRVSIISDTIRINNQLYYKLSPYGSPNTFIDYWLRPTENSVLLLNEVDSTESVLFDYSAVPNQGWSTFISDISGFNQCFWGDSIVFISNCDSIVTANRTFYYCFHFRHYNSTCRDAGLADTWFARDFGIVQYKEITIGGPESWDLVLSPPDTILITGIYDVIGNPCLTNPCVPGVVSIVTSNDTNYVLTQKDIWFQGDFSWKGYSPIPGDMVMAKGIITKRNNINRKEYLTLEIIEFEKYLPTFIDGMSDKLKDDNFILMQNYPNPFNPATNISYDLPNDGQVTIKIYNTLGMEVMTLVNEYKQTGFYKVSFDAGDLASGVYFCKLESGKFTTIKKMVLLR